MSNFPWYKPIIQRSTQKQRTKQTVDTMSSRFGNDWNCVRTITSLNQLSLYGPVAEICEENESFHERTGRPAVMGQSRSALVLSVIKTGFFWFVMTQRIKIFYCHNMTNELRGCHNKIHWVNPGFSVCCWKRTVFHDERHWRSYTISCSGLRQNSIPLWIDILNIIFWRSIVNRSA